MSRMNEPQGSSEQIREGASQAAQGLREMSGQMSEAARQKMEQLREQASEYYEQGRAKAQEWQHNLENYVHDQPVKSLLIAAGVGVVLGMIWKRR